jgi:hypothetical protein
VEPPQLLGLAPFQLGQEQLVEQVVVAEPLAAPVQGHQEEIGLLQRRQHPARSPGGQDGVAQRPRHPLQHRRAGQEHHLVPRDLGQQLGVQVVGQVPVVPGEGEPGRRLVAAGPVGQGGQVQPDRPALGPPEELGHLGVRQAGPGRVQQGHRQGGRPP